LLVPTLRRKLDSLGQALPQSPERRHCLGYAGKALAMQLRVGQFNVLCPAYGVKWGEQEACIEWVSKDEHGGSNWRARWPALQRLIGCARWDILTLEELEDSVCADVIKGLGEQGLVLIWFSHPGREDALGIAYNSAVFLLEGRVARHFPPENPKATTGRVDLRHVPSGRSVRVLVTHQRGGNTEQLEDLFEFAAVDAPEVCVTIVNGDFNEDFGEAAQGLRPGYTTLRRDAEAGEPTVSRPPHKQQPDQTSGKGMIDYIFVKSASGTLTLERDTASREAIMRSHAPCEETGQWPSDHGIEALTVNVSD